MLEGYNLTLEVLGGCNLTLEVLGGCNLTLEVLGGYNLTLGKECALCSPQTLNHHSIGMLPYWGQCKRHISAHMKLVHCTC